MRGAVALAAAALLAAGAGAQLAEPAWQTLPVPGAGDGPVAPDAAAAPPSADAAAAAEDVGRADAAEPATAATPTPNPHPERELLLAVELCRHGDRTPLYSYPLDTLPLSKWPEGVGQLTAVGERAHYETGVRLRRRYVKTGFLPWSWKASEIYVGQVAVAAARRLDWALALGRPSAGRTRPDFLTWVSVFFPFVFDRLVVRQ